MSLYGPIGVSSIGFVFRSPESVLIIDDQEEDFIYFNGSIIFTVKLKFVWKDRAY